LFKNTLIYYYDENQKSIVGEIALKIGLSGVTVAES
jgi:hypothetical protein